ncbi:hypothetical protein K493DRAFT_242094 [Basidiobolus meristosporus CBS 931.73]|uniref:Acyl-CoA desaturase n=1 Tax=Basidiobolus meristosporus CBS 931.73 TaxID=1314790 RepID=A0A1Y1X5Y5_9FUNG|nr:hypothetical protein K493DRAFT_242094 [Basidiobolus meristosporus CBS 931.73]|eukprot:ORX81221.1 hypothetical protein K493DRAFT_242094 [Basidiobolus meristosporus CBS 931.73]
MATIKAHNIPKETSQVPWDKLPLHKRIHWVHTILLTATPLIALYGFLTTPIVSKTMVWAVVYYFMTGIGITGGYHRLWSHKSYSATLPLQIVYAFVGAGAVQGSIKWWSRGHRAHHRHTDTDKDPYSAQKGLIYSHIGWLIMKPEPGKIGHADTSDLNKDPVVMTQHKYYAYLALFAGFIFPTLVAGFGWGDWRGGYFFAAVARLVFLHHSTFCVNSLAHYLGEQNFDDKHSPRDHIITALVTFGEGYHNFHHEFPQDYRNAIKFYQYDPTKWFIRTCALVGLTYDLKCFPKNEITKGQVQMAEKKIANIKKTLDWGTPLSDLPRYSFEEYQRKVKDEGHSWIVVNGVIHDVEEFIEDHPGGQALIKSGIGKDATEAFNGGVYDHSNGAKNLITTMRVGVIESTKEQ